MSVPSSRKLFERPRAPFMENSPKDPGESVIWSGEPRNSWIQIDQLGVVAPINGQVFYRFLRQHAAKSIAGSLHKGQRASRDLDGFRHLARLQRHIDAPLHRHVDRDAVRHDGLKPTLRNRDRVGADRQLGNRVAAIPACSRRSIQPRVDIVRSDARTGNDSAARIGYRSQNRSAKSLRNQ